MLDKRAKRALTLAACLIFASNIKAVDFVVDKIPPIPGSYNPALDTYTACDLLNCGGVGNGTWFVSWGTVPVSFVVLKWTNPYGPEMIPWTNLGFSGVNNCLTTNSTCPPIPGKGTAVILKRYACPPGFSDVPSQPFKCKRVGIDPGKNNSCPAVPVGLIFRGNPFNALVGNKVEVVNDYRDSGGNLSFSRYYTTARTYGDADAVTMGGQWRHSYMKSVSVDSLNGGSSLLLTRETGNYYFFVKNANGNWIPEADVSMRLEENTNPLVSESKWKITAEDGSIERYDGSGKLISISYKHGDILTMTYADGNLASVSDSRGRQLSFSYVNGLFSAVQLPDGGVIKYGYNASATLSSASYPSTVAGIDDIVQYLYEDTRYPKGLTGIIDQNSSRFATWQYDSAARLAASYHGPAAAGIDRTSVVYPTGSASSVTGPLGDVVQYQSVVMFGRAKVTSASQPCAGCGSQYASRSYDANGYPDRLVDFQGVVTDLDYDSNGLEIRRAEGIPAGASGAARTTETDWDSVHRVPLARRVLATDGSLVSSTTWAYNARGQVLTRSESGDGSSMVRESTNQYCEQAQVDAGICPLVGLITTTNGPRTDVSDLTTYTYYPTDDATCASAPTTCPHRKGDLQTVTNAAGHHFAAAVNRHKKIPPEPGS